MSKDQKQLLDDCLLLAQGQYQRYKSLEKNELRERYVKAWAHIVYLIETSY